MLWLACSGGDLIEPETGDIVVRTATVGVPTDAGGYTITSDGGEPQSIAANGAVTVPALDAGPHTVRLAGVPETCILAGENPRTVTVPAGGSVEVTFEVTCPPPPGTVAVTVSTTGLVPDPDGYALQVDRGPGLPIGANATLVLSELSPGQHTLRLNGVAPNCTLAGENPRTIEVAAGIPLTVEFTVTCVLGMLRWTEMASGTNAFLTDVWGTGATDVFVVGEVDTDDGGGVASVIQHYDGTEWARQFRETNLRLRGVWGSSATDVFAVGFRNFTSGAVVLRYDGTRWSESQDLVGEFEDFQFTAVWGSSATDVFAVGAAFDGVFSRTLIVRFDGSAWRRMRVPASPAPSLEDVWGSSATDVYAVGIDRASDPSAGVILRYDGSAWTPALVEEGLVLNGVWGSSATDVFAVGFEVREVGDNFEVAGTIRHFDGARWSRMAVPAAEVLHEVWGSSSTDVYAVGEDGLLLHYDGTRWTESHPSEQILLGVWGSSAVDVFLVGDQGTILHGTP